MKVYMVFIYLTTYPTLWGGGYIEVPSMLACEKLVQQILKDDYYISLKSTYFCTTKKWDGPKYKIERINP